MQINLKAQNKHEEYKETELGLLPKEWEVVRLEEVADFETGKRMKGGALKNGEVISLGGEHIGNFGNISLIETKYISKKFYDSLKQGKIQKNDIIICKDGAKTGKVAYIKEFSIKYMAVNEHVFIIRSKNLQKLNNYFLFCVIFSEIGQSQVKKAYHGLIGGITRNDIHNFKIPLPPLEEQHAIGFVLSTIQFAKEKTEQVIQATKEFKKSLMKHLFTYGPVSLEDVKKVKLKETEIGMVPEEWEVVRLGEIVEYNLGRTPPRNEKASWENGIFPWVSIADMRENNVISYTKEMISNYALKKYFKNRISKKGTLLMSFKLTIGRTAFLGIDATHNEAIISIYPQKNLNKNFLFYYLPTVDYSKYMDKAVKGNTLNKSKIDKIKILLPPLPIQQKIAEILSTVDEKIQAEENKKKALEELFKSMLHNLMTAKIRVKDLVIEDV